MASLDTLARQQAHKLESVGRLAAGVTHEVNTHIQVVSDSLHFVREVPTDADAPAVVDRALESLDRIGSLVRAMREFARPDQPEMAPADLNHLIRSTLVAARNEYKYVADVTLDLAEIPPVTCFRGDVGHAVLDLLVEAAHAVDHAFRGTGRKGSITIRTRHDGDTVLIAVTDNSAQMPGHDATHLDEHLATARAVIVDAHGGDLTFETTPGVERNCVARLPIDGPRSAQGPA